MLCILCHVFNHIFHGTLHWTRGPEARKPIAATTPHTEIDRQHHVRTCIAGFLILA